MTSASYDVSWDILTLHVQSDTLTIVVGINKIIRDRKQK